MWWIIAIVVIVVWGVGGAIFPSTGAHGGPPNGQGCDSCKGLDWWWQGLSDGQKVWEFIWFRWRRIHCYLIGCPTG